MAGTGLAWSFGTAISRMRPARTAGSTPAPASHRQTSPPRCELSLRKSPPKPRAAVRSSSQAALAHFRRRPGRRETAAVKAKAYVSSHSWRGSAQTRTRDTQHSQNNAALSRPSPPRQAGCTSPYWAAFLRPSGHWPRRARSLASSFQCPFLRLTRGCGRHMEEHLPMFQLTATKPAAQAQSPL